MFARRKKLEQPLTPEEALPKLEQYCAYQERSPQEVREKIQSLGLRGDAAEILYQTLETEGFCNEQRFAEGFARGKFRFNHWGRVRIRQAMRQKGISSALVESALQEIDETEYEQVLRNLWEKKMSEFEGDDKARDKVMASLLRAGFESNLVFGLKVR